MSRVTIEKILPGQFLVSSWRVRRLRPAAECRASLQVLASIVLYLIRIHCKLVIIVVVAYYMTIPTQIKALKIPR